MLVMYDSTSVADMPAGGDADAGYTAGIWPTYSAVVAKFPHAHHVSIAVASRFDADALDIEKGDATPDVAPAWVRRQQARGIARPIMYASQSLMPSVLAVLASAGIDRSQVRLWTAHYGRGLHICSPAECGARGFTADATQWSDHGSIGNGHYDTSAVSDTFFDTPVSTPGGSVPPVKTVAPTGGVKLSPAPPTIKQGSSGQVVRNWQGLLNGAGRTCKIDGAFGPTTSALTKDWQSKAGVRPVDGIVGPDTWGRMLGTVFAG